MSVWLPRDRPPPNAAQPADGSDFGGRSCRICGGAAEATAAEAARPMQRCRWSGLAEHIDCAARVCDGGK